ncbi:LysR family transcriptional regulator [Ihubacter sp. mB4P-1]|uniref:LysR family transcriptional regulator n=1 Tax=Ihubacter sp. mB4P-1 TaxID=3242370 RepID=UPI003C7C9EC7
MKEKDIQYVLEIAKQRSFTKAAEALYIAQPALSRHIKQLELNLGGSLFDRNTTPISLTPLGELYISYAEKINILDNQFHHELKKYKSGRKQNVRLGLPILIGDTILNKLLPHIWREHSEIDIDTFADYSSNLINGLFLNRYDIIICGSTFEKPGYAVREFTSDAGVLVASKDLPLLKNYDVASVDLTHPLKITPSILSDETFISCDPSLLHSKVRTMFKEHGTTLRNRLTVPTIPLACSLVEKSIGFTCILRSMLNSSIFSMPKNLCALYAFDLTYPIYIAYNADRYTYDLPTKLIVDYIANSQTQFF